MRSLIFCNGTDLPISVDLEDPFSYSKSPIWITITVIFVSIIILLTIYTVRKLLRSGAKKPVDYKPVFRPKPLNQAKNEYLAKIYQVQQMFCAGQMDARTAHQELSAIVRMFVYDLTGIEAQNFSLNELKARNISISHLIEEFYAPEFALRNEKETLSSIEDARRVILSWN